MMKSLLMSLLLVGLSCSGVWAQGRKISGTVTVEEGAGGFAGATVVIKGTTIGTVTDVKGEYSLNVPSSGTTLVFSAVGMQTVEESIGGRSQIDVQLKTDTKQLTEVIITALG
ncbi:carboxypeptidase-like regulatory domain-containing protein [Spirosoma telluris]|uniref:carboxypeptidase-like regulatory domain-containing protein n=1 Tax=Spirosoma telluris TaxID=2183553 RepID=UPI002FC298AE